MDSCNNYRIEFTSIRNNSIYFKEKGDGNELLCDSLKQSCEPPFPYLIRSKDNKCLLLDAQNQLRACDIPKSMECACNFFLQMYNDSNLDRQKGRAVILYTNHNNKKIVVCCNERNEIYTMAMDPPCEMIKNEHNAVFYLMKLSASNKYEFESAAYADRFLGFQPDNYNPSEKKLVLQTKTPNEVDDSTQITLCSAPST